MRNPAFTLRYRTFWFLLIIFTFSAASVSAQSMFRKVTDFDGDGRADFAVVRAKGSTLIWHILGSSSGYVAQRWGTAGLDRPAAGDYDGDGKTDAAVYREAYDVSGARYSYSILQSQTNTPDSITFTDFMYNFNSPQHQDYDGDGKADPACHYGEYGMLLPLKIRLSTFGYVTTYTVPQWHSVARIGDMDGDGRADLAYVNTGILKLMNFDGSNQRSVDISALNGLLVPADFDGDGKGDIAVWRNWDGMWLWLRSSDGALQTTRFGSSGDIPVPADYDGDGKTDQAIWRPGTSQAYYWIKGSQAGLRIVPWGVSTDKVVRY